MYAVRIALIAVAFALGPRAPCNAAEIRALLIGVSVYDESIGLASLRGPANDVRLWQQTLAGRGVSDIRILADGVDGGAIPTRAAVLAAFADLARSSSAGDLAIITLSGHGTRQPDTNGDEADGLDELFLPADTARAQPGANAIPNAILDDDIGDARDGRQIGSRQFGPGFRRIETQADFDICIERPQMKLELARTQEFAFSLTGRIHIHFQLACDG